MGLQFEQLLGVVDQDLHLLSYAVDSGRALVLVLNKWELLDAEARDDVMRELHRRLAFVGDAP